MGADASGAGNARAAAEWTARTSYGKLIAQLTARCGDVSRAEDALADAFASALATWPVRGVPDNPEAWLMTAARRKTTDSARRAQTAARHVEAETPLLADAAFGEPDAAPLTDRRLELMFLCAHPAIPAAAHTGLMLQAVLGFTAAEIAAATLETEAAIAQRLARAKRQLTDSNVPFALPPEHILRERMIPVQRAIYAVYTNGWEDMIGGTDRMRGLATEAEWLARCLVNLAPDDPEAKGLLALILYCESRREARRDAKGRYVPLDRQDPLLWDIRRIEEATALLTKASTAQAPGRFQLEAAIQSVHVGRGATGRTDWDMIIRLYDVLLEHAPTVGVRLGRAAAYLGAGKPHEALNSLAGTPWDDFRTYAPAWAIRGHIQKATGASQLARLSFQRAAELTADEATREWLLVQWLDG